MKFLRTVSEEKEAPKTETSCDKIEDPKILSNHLLNTKASYRRKKYSHIRISELGSFCPRCYAIGYLTDTATEDFTNFALHQQFDLGSALHWYMQNHSKVFKDVIVGNWVCKGCNNLRKNSDGSNYFGSKPKSNCETCGALPGATEYKEFYFRINEPYRVTGKIDAVLHKDGVYRFSDFKSYFEKPEGGFPNGKDVTQIAGYAFFYNYVQPEKKFPVDIDTDYIYLHYISKKFSYKESILTYPIRPSQAMIDEIIKRVSEFTEATKTGNIPAAFDVCAKSKFSKGKAKQCPFSETCSRWYNNGRNNF